MILARKWLNIELLHCDWWSIRTPLYLAGYLALPVLARKQYRCILAN